MSLPQPLHDAGAWLRNYGLMTSRGASGPERVVSRLRVLPERRMLAHLGSLDAIDALGASVAARIAEREEAPSLRVLVLNVRGWTAASAYESILAQSLRLRGAEIAFLNCGGGQPICELGRARRTAPRPCDRCAWYTDAVARANRAPQFRLAEGYPWGSRGDEAPAEPPAVPVDSHGLVEISATGYLRRASIADDPEGPAVVRDFAVAAAGVEIAAAEVLDGYRPDLVIMLNGLYAAERAVRAMAVARGIRVVTYEIPPRTGTLVLSHDEPAPEYVTDDAWAAVRDEPLDVEQTAALEAFMDGLSRGVGSAERHIEGQAADAAAVRRALDVPDGSRLIGLFTNMTWDSACIGKDVAFDSMLDWLLHAIISVRDVPDATLVVRVHPAERRWGTREPAVDYVRERLGSVPANVRLVGPDDEISSYRILDAADQVLAYTTTVGLEAAVRGLPVAVAGRTHYRGRGFTTDLESRAALEQFVRTRAPRLPAVEHDLARRYAFMFFFRFSLPFSVLDTDGERVRSFPTDVSQIEPGADPWLDWVCDRIVDGRPFLLPAAMAGVRTPVAV